MNHIGDLQQTFEKIENNSADTVHAKSMIITEVDNNIRLLKESKQQKLERLAYYRNMLDSSIKKEEATEVTKTGAAGQRSGSLVRGKKDGKSSELGATTNATEAGASALALSHPSKITKIS